MSIPLAQQLLGEQGLTLVGALQVKNLAACQGVPRQLRERGARRRTTVPPLRTTHEDAPPLSDDDNDDDEAADPTTAAADTTAVAAGKDDSCYRVLYQVGGQLSLHSWVVKPQTGK
jgi:hypothetical protein